jgi:hypothetical protein
VENPALFLRCALGAASGQAAGRGAEGRSLGRSVKPRASYPPVRTVFPGLWKGPARAEFQGQAARTLWIIIFGNKLILLWIYHFWQDFLHLSPIYPPLLRCLDKPGHG